VCLQRRRGARAFNCAKDVILTDGGIETRIIYEFKRPIGEFEAYQLLADDRAAIFLGGCRGTD
jgi:hypothetical protein